MKIEFLIGILGALAITACDAGIEPIDHRIKPVEEWSDEWDEYAATLYNYKQSDHYLIYVRFDNATEHIESEKNSIRSLPDSLDIVALANPISKFDREDFAKLQRRATKVLATADCSNPETALQRFNETLATVKADKLDGIVVRYAAAVSDAARTAETEIAAKLAGLSGKLRVFEGNAAFVAAGNRNNYDLWLIDATSADDIYAVENDVDYLTGYLGIDSERILPLVPLTGTINDETGAAQSSPAKAFEIIRSRSLAGLALSGVSTDYYALTGNYPRLRAAIDLLNPAHK